MTMLDAHQQLAVERVLVERLLAAPTTASELARLAREAAGPTIGDPCYRFVDRWLQRHRKRGNLRWRREGVRILWVATPLAKERGGFDVAA